ncbi:hypothetical protein LSH36_716g00014 [Paralvinella palmiformis]|uniref:Uncharacterized protein n=1 Tax=Paralvinella palmiformis TaxID=53620 RepID=A0AAD9J269_9ANNE|nr:hypothetical protein LSH36_716g00014 [Paralvinella palmiformis]
MIRVILIHVKMVGHVLLIVIPNIVVPVLLALLVTHANKSSQPQQQQRLLQQRQPRLATTVVTTIRALRKTSNKATSILNITIPLSLSNVPLLGDVS